MKSWTIKKKLTILLSSLIILLLFNIIGMIEIAKTGYFTFLEREHLVGIERAKINLNKIKEVNDKNKIMKLLDHDAPDFHDKGVIQAVTFAQLQAENCLNAVIEPEILLFNLLGFGEAIEICQKDLISSDNFLSITNDYNKGDINKAQFFQKLTIPLKEMEYHSKRFAILIPEIRSFMVNLIIIMIGTCSIVLIFSFVMVFKALQKDLSILCSNVTEVGRTNKLNHKTFQAGHDDEVGIVSQSFATLVKKFASIIRQIQSSNNTLTSESKKLNLLAERANNSVTNQFEKTEQVSISVEQMSSASEEVSGNITKVAIDINDINCSAKQGQNVVDNTIDKLKELGGNISDAGRVVNKLATSGEQVSDVLNVIMKIADQTNLLALNAAIEAARAGDHGRGFAVVSDEVRSLATHTQQSAQEIETIINEFKSGSEAAVTAIKHSETQAIDTIESADGVKKSFDSITELSKSIVRHTHQVSSAVEEQTQSLADINNNISTLKVSADETKKIAEQTHSASLVLSENVNEMNKCAILFKV